MDRRKFIVGTALTAFSMSAFGKALKQTDGSFKGDCETTNDILGPFYRAGAPLRTDMTYEGLAGTRIVLKGNVYTDDCTTPLKDALVEIWHCNAEGEYDNETDNFYQRASWKTNEKGEYTFTTILPGKYLNGDLFRPSHIHYRVTCARHKELISQIYFKGDPHIADDHWASDKKAVNRILPIMPVDTKGNLTIQFDIYLAKSKKL
ncbi:MAG TPA: hypothetical protein VK177_03370 [Flavobacteriales bacterium]|nr:hypothetical protein [Flavobacteriales bacterium]